MATIDNEKVIKGLIELDGYYMNDPRVYQIVEYTTYEGKQAWGVTWENEPINRIRRYEIPSTYVIAPKVIWSQTNNAPNMETKG